MRREALIVVAAGLGARLGAEGGQPKALATVSGVTLLERALQGVRAAGLDHVVLVHTPGLAAAFADTAHRYGVVASVPGGETRSASVRAGVDALPGDVAVIGVHDAARALTPPELFRTVFDAVEGDVVAAAPGVAVADTLKRVDAVGTVVETVGRADLQGVQTPQVFRAEVLRAVHRSADEASDDLALVEGAIARGELAGRVRLVAGSPRAFKVTYPADLELASALMAAERSSP